MQHANYYNPNQHQQQGVVENRQMIPAINPNVKQHIYAPTPNQVQNSINQLPKIQHSPPQKPKNSLNNSISSLIPQGVKQSFHFNSGLPQYFHKILAHSNNQFSYGGTNSCTYCSLESALYALSGKICPEKISDDVTRTFVDDILRSGVSLDLKLGVRSTDEVIPLIPRFSKHVESPWICLGQLAIHNCFDIALASMEKKAEEKKSKSACAILTKPPESIMLYYRKPSPDIQYPYIVFDSHPRSWKQSKGAAFYCFTSRKTVIQHLQLLYKPIFENIPQHAKTYEQIKYDMFELNVLCNLMNPPIAFNVPPMKTVSERTKEAAQKAHLLQSTHLTSAAQQSSSNFSAMDPVLERSLSSFSPLSRSVRPHQQETKFSKDEELLPLPSDPSSNSPLSPPPPSSYTREAALEAEVAILKEQLAQKSEALMQSNSRLESAYLEIRSLRKQLDEQLAQKSEALMQSNSRLESAYLEIRSLRKQLDEQLAQKSEAL
eukprot:CAMPEP_0117425914 /NCGR_PEP_ID=MMETSP0758-20121206/6129_1 /TAXON_ID=63605 /ORGANISM="Percolomonas cosmopolitus, Strain AE-1 (ATCC 50343)" /LENGTH=489 /DNA_ID=CAMNT_0005210761 /DNA_START=390 /DNA_END=1855 /DNA_ORIENTATION=+